MTPKHPPGPPMTLSDMRELGAQQLIGFCHNEASWRAAGHPEQGVLINAGIGVRSWGEPDASGWRE
jgi:hypothetical protein